MRRSILPNDQIQVAGLRGDVRLHRPNGIARECGQKRSFEFSVLDRDSIQGNLLDRGTEDHERCA